MPATDYRLRKEKDIMRVVRGKRGVFDPVCGVKYAPNGLAKSRFTVVAGTKVDKRAVVRNRLRRQYREIVRAHLSEIAHGLDIVLLVSKPAIDLAYAEKEEKLLRVLRKARLVRA